MFIRMRWIILNTLLAPIARMQTHSTQAAAPAAAASQQATGSTPHPTHSVGGVVTLKYKPSGTSPTAAESRGPKALQWVQGCRRNRQQSKLARAVTAQQMVKLPLVQELQGAMRSTRQTGMVARAAGLFASFVHLVA